MNIVRHVLSGRFVAGFLLGAALGTAAPLARDAAGSDLTPIPDWDASATLLRQCKDAPIAGCPQLRELATRAIAMCGRVVGEWEDEGRPELTDAKRAHGVRGCLELLDSDLPAALRSLPPLPAITT